MSIAPGELPLLAAVAPPLPVPGLFDYLVPESLASSVVPGVRALVPFGGRTLTAMVVEVGRRAPPAGVEPRPLLRLVESQPLAGPDILQLAGWMARMYGCSVGEALDAALPRAARLGRSAQQVEQAVLLVAREVARQAVEQLLPRREKQARALRILLDRGGCLPARELMSLAHVSRSPLESLARAGQLRLEHVRAEPDRLLGGPVERRPPLALTEEQAAALARLLERFDGLQADPGAGRQPVLLHGVTGSGKTEIYLQLLAHAVAAGRQGIVLVPEISLTPQTVRRFRERFERVAVLHSHLTDRERHEQWCAIRDGAADVVVGARSAVFAPLQRLGVIVLDEEHETSFKQQNVPRYHARDVACERARLSGALVLFGTATPSLETWQQCRLARTERLVLSQRVAGGRTPEVQVVDLTSEQRRKSFSFLTDPLRSAMADALGRQGQVLLFLNRRGWAPVLLCRSCRGALHCPHCAVSMTLHQRIGRVLCHYCGHEEPPPAACRVCGQRLSPLGFGTEKVEQEVAQAFPGAHVARMDSDTMSGRGAHEKLLDAFARGAIDVLVGTQMIAKGLDFPNALLVGVLCADSALFLPDYRAAERTFQLLAQVTGRTGRGPKGGRVVVQAYDPRHLSIRAGVAQDFEAFARQELSEREALGYPPFGRIVRIVIQGPQEEGVRRRASEVGRLLRRALGLPEVEPAGSGSPGVGSAAASAGSSPAAGGAGPAPASRAAPGAHGTALRGQAGLFADWPAPDGAAPQARPAVPQPAPAGPPAAVELLGPAAAPIPRINRQHRSHLVAKCAGDAEVERVLAALVGHCAPVRRVRVLVDVDPMSML